VVNIFRTLNNVFRKVKRHIWIDGNCQFCNMAIKRLETDYMKKDELLILRPTWNAGIVTHYHMSIIKISELEMVRKSLERQYKIWVLDND
jgi:hypothetical protein